MKVITKNEALQILASEEKITANILQFYQENVVPANYHEGLGWYQRAYEICVWYSKKYNKPVNVIAGMLAALSPGTNWAQNIVDLENVLNGLQTNKRFDRITVTSYNSNKLKAIAIYSMHTDNEIFKKLKGSSKEINKTSSFFLNILQPTNNNYVTIDRHTIKIALNGYFYNSSKYTGPGLFDGIIDNGPEDIETIIALTEKRYKLIRDCFKTAGRKLGLRGLELQSIVWIAYRNKYIGIFDVAALKLDRFIYGKVIFGRARSVYAEQSNIPF